MYYIKIDIMYFNEKSILIVIIFVDDEIFNRILRIVFYLWIFIVIFWILFLLNKEKGYGNRSLINSLYIMMFLL